MKATRRPSRALGVGVWLAAVLLLPAGARAVAKKGTSPRSLVVFFQAQNRGEVDPCG